jgi:hypothetical protein
MAEIRRIQFRFNAEHFEILKKGVDIWNNWRQENPSIKPDLSGVKLVGVNLVGVNFSEANLQQAIFNEANLSNANLLASSLDRAHLINTDLSNANLIGADLAEADLSEAILLGANLSGAHLSSAILRGTNLYRAHLVCANLVNAELVGAVLAEAVLVRADLIGADLSSANLRGANLSKTRLIEVKMNKETILSDCNVYGISVWGVTGLEEAEQSNLIITTHNEPVITVDNLEVAQFIYILINSEKIRNVIDTLTSKVVLILGRFTKKRKAILDAIRCELRERNYLPLLFDFPEPNSKDLTETIETLARMARFVIADITAAASVREELRGIVHDLPSLPVQPILQSSAKKYDMFRNNERYPWVLKTHRYNDLDDLLKSLTEKVIAPAEEKVKELRKTTTLT